MIRTLTLKFTPSAFIFTAGLSLVFSGVPARAQRLPQDVHPEHYTLTLTPDLKNATFTGDESIAVDLAMPADSITLNAAEIQFQKVTIDVGAQIVPATVALRKEQEQAIFHFPRQLPAGKLTLHIRYTGILNNELRGFYLSKTSKRNYAVTQFEPTDARRAFPCFDEPALKATFDVTLVADKGDTAISNTNVVSDTPGPVNGKHTVHFAVTPRMSTYLVAFLVGDFRCLSGQSDGVPIRVCATPEKVEEGALALQAAEYNLHYYNQYFGIKYPMPKLDLVGIPDFEAGAMENFGAITYRERDLLIEESTAPLTDKMNVALVVAHEMAHQWFGDMVTMNWWNNVWLNEGFATWLELKPVAAWHPEWPIGLVSGSVSPNQALNLDARRETHAIRAKAETRDEINEMFDGIAYEKAGAVLAMVENYLGEETFRRGIHSYLSAHMYGNATAEDFWNAQTETSHKPVDKIMESLIVQPGEPLITFEHPQNGAVKANQTRFFLDAKATQSTQTWTVPVCFRPESGEPACELFSRAEQSLSVPHGTFLFADAGGKGYYRSSYESSDYHALLVNIEGRLNPLERVSVVGDEYALMHAGKSTVADYLNLAIEVKGDRSYEVLGSIASGLQDVYSQIASTEKERAEVAAWIRRTYGPELEKTEVRDAAGLPERQARYAVLFRLLGAVEDPTVISAAKTMAAQYVQDRGAGNADLGKDALFIAARNGDAALFNRLQHIAEQSTNSQLQTQALYSLALFKDPALERRALEYAASGKVKNQDAVVLFASAMRDYDTRAVAWQYIQQNWPQVKQQLTSWSGGALVESTGSFCSTEKREEVTRFFSTNKVAASERALKRAQDRINECVDFRAEQEPKLAQWLADHANGIAQAQ